MFDIFVRAAHHEPLTAVERAYLKALQGVVIGALATAGIALLTELLNGKALNTALLISFVMTLVYSLLGALVKFFSAHGETLAAQIIQSGIDQIKQDIPAQPLPVASVPLPGMQSAAISTNTTDTPK